MEDQWRINGGSREDQGRINGGASRCPSVGLVLPLSYSLSYSLNWFTEPVHCSMRCPIHWLIQSPTFQPPHSYYSNTAYSRLENDNAGI
jgi:hypothetical protein